MSIIWSLFRTFFKIGLLSIGGGYAIIPLIQEQVVRRTGWISEKMFTDIITISQMTPGPLAVNTSTFVGLQAGGLLGAVAATTGCVLCGAVISVSLYRFFRSRQSSIYILELLNGLKSASLGPVGAVWNKHAPAGCDAILTGLDGLRLVWSNPFPCP